jgi:hypothetical protein
MVKTAFCSVIFPANLIYFKDFLDSLEQQTNKDFTLLLFNDGVLNLVDYLKHTHLDYKIINVKGSVSQTRTQLFEYIKESSYENFIFGDTDDYFSLNRVEVCTQWLEKVDIIANDLILVSNDKIQLTGLYWENRPELKETISIESIKNYNFLGLGNTAINKNVLPNQIKFDSNLVALDWYFFSILLKKSWKVGFTSQSVVYYRQHNANIVGRKEMTFEDFKKGFNVKLNHYISLAKINADFQELAIEYSSVSDTISDINYKNSLQNSTIKNPFWWEEIQI